ncbi:MAG: hydrogenase maturation nickel metallochaperone HypA [Fibrobacter sp.]|jgi:hydrogenase nickel incorporation protein HypA/HybF|nr:hydrogenase maturation nickel metallochaperone HypA [Fibrobacter sp.]
MHELSIVENLLKVIESAAAENGISRVTGVNLRIGRLRQVVPEMFQFAFDTAKIGTVAESAEVKINFVPAKAVCRDCGREFAVEDNFFVCEGCNGVDVDVIEGKELQIESMEGE